MALPGALDGSEPDELSPLFPASLAVTSRAGQANTHSMKTGTATANQHTDGWKPPLGEVRKATVVRARAFRPDAQPSPVVTHTYFIGAAARHTDGLPVLSLATDPATWASTSASPRWSRMCATGWSAWTGRVWTMASSSPTAPP